MSEPDCKNCGIPFDAHGMHHHCVMYVGDVAKDWRDDEITALRKRVEALEGENDKAWRERNVAYAKVKAWEAVVYVEGLPLRAVRVDEWGPGEGAETSVPEITPKKLTELLDRLQALQPNGEAE